MSGDYSRLSFDPKRHYAAVEMQQGRVLTDADWNEQAALLARRIQVGTLDTVGRAVAPRALPSSFEITLANGQLAIGHGRMYVDGLLVENHGTVAVTPPARPVRGATPPRLSTALTAFAPTPTDAWDSALAETYGSAPTPFGAQPFVPVASELPRAGSWVAYLDVWQREVTHLQDPALVEKALGVDTTTRLQTVWQVKLHEVGRAATAAGATCENALVNDATWNALIAAPSSRLTTGTATVPGEPDPCLLPPGDGYKGLENQLYRVEIHRAGTAGNATFKWSRDNASVATRVARIVDATHVVVDSIGKDGVLRFSDGDWVEFIDEARELSGQSGELRRIRVGDGVDDATRRLTLDQPLPAPEFAPGVPEASRALRVRRWDQKGKVRRADGTVHADLDVAGSSGAIPVPAAGTSLLLENGVVVSFALQPGGSGRYRAGEWWVFAARTADASVESLLQAPPRGPHHHYAKLAVVSFPGTVDDCRVLWPPEAAQGEGCACTVCVSPAAHADGSLTIQAAIAQVQRRGGGTVCLDVGQYVLTQPLLIERARSVRLRGQGSATVVLAPVEALHVRGSDDVVIEDLSLRTVEAPASPPTTPTAPTPGTTVGTAPVRPAALRVSGDAQRLSSVATRSSRTSNSLRAATLEDRQVSAATPGTVPAAAATPQGLVTVTDSREVRLLGLWLRVGNADDVRDDDAGSLVAGIGLIVHDAAPGLGVEHCQFEAPLGIVALRSSAGTGTGTTAPRVAADTRCTIRSNRFESRYAALMLTSEGLAAHLQIEDNVIESERFGLLVGGARSARVTVQGNDIRAASGILAANCALLNVNRNLLRGAAGREGASGGVLLMGVGTDARWGIVEICDNLVGGIRGVAVGVAGVATGMKLRFSRNRLTSVGRGLVFSDYEATTPGRGGATSNETAADSIRVDDNEIAVLARTDAAPGDAIPEPDALALRAGSVRVDGNSIEAASIAALVGVDATTLCEFSSNHCTREGVTARGAQPDVHLRAGEARAAGTIVAASNQVRGVREIALAVEPLPLAEQRRSTVIGNITRGQIRVFGAPLPSPLDAFNVIGGV